MTLVEEKVLLWRKDKRAFFAWNFRGSVCGYQAMLNSFTRDTPSFAPNWRMMR